MFEHTSKIPDESDRTDIKRILSIHIPDMGFLSQICKEFLFQKDDSK